MLRLNLSSLALIFLLAVSLFNCASAENWVRDIALEENLTWTVENSPYVIIPDPIQCVDDYAITIFGQLTIEPGVQVQFAYSEEGYSLIVADGGYLYAIGGTGQDEINITGGQYEWDGIVFENGSNGQISNCSIYGALTGIKIYCDNPIPIIQNNYFNYCKTALYFNGCDDDAEEHAVKNNEIHYIYEKAIICESSILFFDDNLICEYTDPLIPYIYGFYLDESDVTIKESDFQPGESISCVILDCAIYCLNCAPEIYECRFYELYLTNVNIRTAITCIDDDGYTYSADIHNNYFWLSANIELYGHSAPEIYDNVFQDGYGPGSWASPDITWISLMDQSTAIIEKNYFWKPAGVIYTVSTSSTPALIRNNVIIGGVYYATYGVHAISVCNDDSKVQIYNNIFHHMHNYNEDSYCISLSDNDPGTNCKIYNNTFSDWESNIIFIEQTSAIYDVDAKNNNYYDIDGDFYCTYTDPNYIEIQDIGEEDAMNTNPLFVNPNYCDPFDCDFRLSYTSSLINAGYDIDDFNDPDGSRNDVGAFGGPNSMLPHYVLIPDDAEDFDMILPSATYKIECDIEVDDADGALTILGNTKMQFVADKGIIVSNSGTLLAEGEEDHPIEMESYPEENCWDGILIEESASANSVFEYLNMDNASKGIHVCEVDLSNDIIHCDFTNMDFGVYLSESNTNIGYCDFANCATGIYLYYSDASIVYNEISVDEYGIVVVGSTEYQLEHNSINNYQDNNDGIKLIAAGGQLIGNTISGVDCGLYLINSNPRMKDNLIDDCNGYGMYLISGSQPVMNFFSYHATNRIANCGDHEVHIIDYQFPLIKNGYNDLIDEVNPEDYIIYASFAGDPEYVYDVKENYWVETSIIDVRDRIYPSNVGYQNFRIICSSLNDLSNTGYQPLSFELDELLSQAFEFEMNDQYEEAYDIYESITDNYPNDQAAKTAFTRMYYCYCALGWDLQELLNNYEQIKSNVTEYNNLFYIERSKCLTLRKIQDYDTAMVLLYELVEFAQGATDSVFVLMDIESTLFEMSQSGAGLNSVGGNNYSDPQHGFFAYANKIDELSKILENHPISDGNDDKIVPEEYRLLYAFPNPFNANTRILYKVLQLSQVNIDIFSITGQKVCALLDGITYAGEFNIEWDASEMSSGVYFVKISINPSNGDSPLTSVNKILLLK